MVTNVPPRDKPKRTFISKHAPAPYEPAAKPMAAVMGKGKRPEGDNRVLRKRKRRRALLHPLPLKV